MRGASQYVSDLQKRRSKHTTTFFEMPNSWQHLGLKVCPICVLQMLGIVLLPPYSRSIVLYFDSQTDRVNKGGELDRYFSVYKNRHVVLLTAAERESRQSVLCRVEHDDETIEKVFEV